MTLAKRGFTLIEIMMALLIFAIMAAICSKVLFNAFNSREKTNKQALALAQLQIAQAFIDNDLSQIVSRYINQGTTYLPILEGNKSELSFSRGGITNPFAKEKRSTLTRVKYMLSGHQLIRQSSPFIDSVSKKPEDMIMAKDVESLEFAYLDKHLQAQSDWKLLNLPKAIRITIKFKTFGEISRLYVLPNGYRHYEKIRR